MILLVMEPGKRLEVWRSQLELTFPTIKVLCAQEDQMVLDLAEQYKPELLVLDYDLPESGPFYLMRRVKTTSPSSKFILLTSSVGQQEMAKMGGADLVHLQNISVKHFISSINHTFPHLLSHKNGKQTLLIAGNGDEFYKNLHDSLLQKGYMVKSVRDGAHIIFGVVEHPVDMVIMDMNLPDFDGMRVIRVIRRIKQDLPIVGVCQSSEDFDTTQSERYNIKIVSQPIDMQDFLSFIETYF